MVLKHICEYQTVAFGAITSFQSFDHLTQDVHLSIENEKSIFICCVQVQILYSRTQILYKFTQNIYFPDSHLHKYYIKINYILVYFFYISIFFKNMDR